MEKKHCNAFKECNVTNMRPFTGKIVKKIQRGYLIEYPDETRRWIKREELVKGSCPCGCLYIITDVKKKRYKNK